MRVAFFSGGDWIIALLTPNLTADLNVDVAVVSGCVDHAEELLVIDLATFTGEHEARTTFLDDGILHVNETRPRQHCLDGSSE